jgi:hypothetical protein
VSVEYIKKFTHLKILNLKMTDIKPEAQRNILRHLSNCNPCPLELYGCTYIDSCHLDTLVQLIPNIRELRTAYIKTNKPICHCRKFHNLKTLSIDYIINTNFLKNLSKSLPNLQELKIERISIESVDIFENWSNLNKLFLRTYIIESSWRFHPTHSFLQHVNLITYDSIDVETLRSVLTKMPNLGSLSLGVIGGRVQPETVALLSERCKTTVLLEDRQFASLYEHPPGVTIDTELWPQINLPLLFGDLLHNNYGSLYCKRLCQDM